eukprot:scaffold330372_cov58-Tisochrysis_lutea.AAC.1
MDRLFAYPNTNSPESLKALYVIAWKYILVASRALPRRNHIAPCAPIRPPRGGNPNLRNR